MLDEIIVTDTIPLHEKAKNIANIRQILYKRCLLKQSKDSQRESVSTLLMIIV